MLNRTTGQPPVLSAALLWDAWETKEPLQHLPWLGHLLVGAMLRQVGKTTAHLICLNTGLRAISRDRRRARDRTARLIGFLDGVTEAAASGLKEHDRLILAREQGTTPALPARTFEAAAPRRSCACPAARLQRHDRRGAEGVDARGA
ncbi:DUF1612 domain-containing protein [Mesorhizobium sp. M0663]|uniref:DUF1612 domain-containing protein n=1 Tax=Mesorhizobium sp. M0663 TaxID=2956981 RepID=UPI00333748D7